MGNWMATLSGVEVGPLSDAQLQQLADTGKLTPDDLVRKEGGQQAVPAARVKGLFRQVNADNQPDTPPKERTGILRETPLTFSAWYATGVGKWSKPLQILAWIFYGFLWIPGWWGVTLANSEDSASRDRGKKVLKTVAAGLVLFIILAHHSRSVGSPDPFCQSRFSVLIEVPKCPSSTRYLTAG
jgi:hypothetical protein